MTPRRLASGDDAPASFVPVPEAGDAGKVIAVNEAEDGYELAQSGASVPDPETGAAGQTLMIVQDPADQDAVFNITPTPSTFDGGVWTITYGGDTTAPIAFDANHAAVIAAVEALPSIGPDDVGLDGGILGYPALTVTFQGSLGGQPISGLTADGSGLTGADSPYSLDVSVVEVGVTGGPKTWGLN